MSDIILRTYAHVARQQHGPCCDCFEEILPGEEYEGIVWACRGRIDVLKRHIVCPDPHIPDDWTKEEDNGIFELLLVA